MKRRFAGLRGLAAVAALLSAPSLVAAAPALVTGTQLAFDSPAPSATVLRERGVSLSLGNLAKAAVDRPALIDLALFEDANFTMHVQRTEPTYSGGVAYIGTVLGPGMPMQPAIIVDNGGVVVGKFTANGRRFSLRGTSDRGYVAREHVSVDPPDHPETTMDLRIYPQEPNRIPGTKAAPVLGPPPPAVGADTNNNMDLMVVYTQAARAANGGVALMNASVDAEVASVNVIYANSLVVQRLRLVFRGEVTYTETNMNTDLSRVTLTNDGFLDEVPMMRNLYGADFVSLWGSYGSECGLGWIMAQESSTFQTNGYNVIGSPLCTDHINNTLAHELGHNMGLNHDNTQDPNTTTKVSPEGWPADPGQVVINYSRGYVDTPNRFRTVMAYDTACTNLGFNCFRAPYFSSPNVSFNNNLHYGPAVLAPTGFSVVPSPPMNPTSISGGPYEAQALNDTRETTQNFRQAVTLGGPGTVSIMPTSYTVAEGGGSVMITVGRALGSTGAISVQYATANGTATAGTDYTLTAGTLNWANGDGSNKTIMVPILQDTLLEGNETFTVTLSAPTGGAAIDANGTTANVKILDDEPDSFPVSSLLPGGYLSPNVPNANTPNSSWTVTLTEGYQSGSSVQSAQARAPDNLFSTMGTSDMTYTGNFRAGNVTFFYKLSSYDGAIYSGFDFLVDNIVVATVAGGEVNWTQASRSLTAGVHTLTWRFKNLLPFPCSNVNPPATGGANCADRVWLDNVVLPLARKLDFSGEGNTDLAWGNTDGTQAIWLMNGTGVTATQQMIGAATGWSISNVADFNGDGKGDLVWQNTDGRIAIYLMNGTVPTLTQQILNAGGGWSVSHTPDVNGDGKADLLFRNVDGTVAVWTMNGAVMTAGATIIGPGTGWSVIKTGDFDGDGKDDLLWRHTDGRHAIWLMNGINVKATGQILNAGGWTALHATDLDGDGRADIVWQHSDGTLAAWIMNGTSFVAGTTILGAGSGWSVTRTGDFDGDGKADLFFLHSDGRAAIWLMNGLVAKSTQQILNAGGGWSASRLGDLNGDGKADIVWRNVDGRVAVWLMNGTSLVSGAEIFGAGNHGWSVHTISQ